MKEAMEQSGRYNAERLSIIESDLLMFDAIAEWLIAVTDVFILALLFSRRSPQVKKWRAMSLALSAVITQLIAVRRLVLSGLDVPAKQILRCLVEHMDLAVRLNVDPKMITEYLKYDRIDGSKGARRFWSLYLQKSKNYSLRGAVYQRMETLLGKTTVQSYADYRQEEDMILNTSIHPNRVSAGVNLTGTMYLAAEKDDSLGGLPHLGLIDESSGRTLSYAITAMADYAMFGYIPKWKDLPRACRNDPTAGIFCKEACDHIHRGFEFVPSVVKYHWHLQVEERKMKKKGIAVLRKRGSQ
jgi:hypothetical protein